MRLLTIGYREHTPAAVMEAAAEAGAGIIVDIRDWPFKRNGYHREDLEAAAQAAGLGYRLWRRAGNPYRPPVYSVAMARHNYQGKIVREDLAGRALVALEAQMIRGDERPRCLLCACEEAENCHRGWLAEAIALHARERGLELSVHHIRVAGEGQGDLFDGSA